MRPSCRRRRRGILAIPPLPPALFVAALLLVVAAAAAIVERGAGGRRLLLLQAFAPVAVVAAGPSPRRRSGGHQRESNYDADAYDLEHQSGSSSPPLPGTSGHGACRPSADDGSPPVVGVLSQPLAPRLRRRRSSSSSSAGGGGTKSTGRGATKAAAAEEEFSSSFFIAASYVKWLEAGGARTIAVPYDAEPELLDDVLEQIDMLFLPGGEADLSPAVSHLLRAIHRANANASSSSSFGFPVWGTCLGMEFLLSHFGRDDGPLPEAFDAENVSLPLHQVVRHPRRADEDDRNATATGRSLYSDRSIYRIVTRQAVTLNNHRRGMSPQTFRSNPKLASLWAITSTNEDRLGRPFVSTLEPLRQQFPYYGVQYHPEKNAFEYGFQAGTSIPYEAISHSFDAVRFSLHVAQFAVELAREGRRDRIRDRSDDCRRPRHEYTDPERFPPMYTYPVRSGLLPGFEQVYIVPPASAWPPPPAAPRPLGETAESAPLPASLLDSTASSSASTS